MSRNRIWYILPTAVLPYLVLLALAVIFFSTNHPVFAFLMESVFGGNALLLIAALLLYCAFAGVFSVVCFVNGIRKDWDALSLARNAMILKLCQVPAYVMIFVLGIALAITLFTIPFAIGLFLLDCLTLCLTGFWTAAAAINAVRQGVCQSKEVLWIVLLQLVFCADVVATIVFYCKLRRSVEDQMAQI